MKCTSEGEIIINFHEIWLFIKPYFFVFILAYILGFIRHYFHMKHMKQKINIDSKQNINNDSRYLTDLLKKIYISFVDKNIENIVFLISIFLVILSITLQCFNIFNGFSNTVINIFGTLIVSWIATKKSAETEIKKKEKENAKKSWRYLNSIRMTASNAIKILSSSIENNTLKFSSEQITVLERAKDQMEHIESGIGTSIIDWEDMMSKEDIADAHGDKNNKKKVKEASSTVPDFDQFKFESSEQINQEEA